MAMSGMWMLVVFYGIIYALTNDFGSDFFIGLAVLGTIAYVTAS